MEEDSEGAEGNQERYTVMEEVKPRPEAASDITCHCDTIPMTLYSSSGGEAISSVTDRPFFPPVRGHN